MSGPGPVLVLRRHHTYGEHKRAREQRQKHREHNQSLPDRESLEALRRAMTAQFPPLRADTHAAASFSFTYTTRSGPNSSKPKRAIGTPAGKSRRLSTATSVNGPDVYTTPSAYRHV